jgi:hypothetical protein
MIMKNQILGLTLGLALLGAVITASAQSSLLAGWNMYTPSTQTFPYAASSTDASVSSASLDYAGLFGINDSRGVWASTNYATTLDTATAPYLAWTITLDAGPTVADPTFFASLAKLDSSTKLELRCSLDDYASSLGDLSSVDGSYQNYLFPLAGPLSGSVTFRLYFYNVNPIYLPTYYNVFNAECASYYTTIGGTFDDNMNGKSAGLLGDIVPAPEPVTLALAGLSGLGLLLFRRKS